MSERGTERQSGGGAHELRFPETQTGFAGSPRW
jgi:hypothetical protein